MKKKTFTCLKKAFDFANKTTNNFYFENHGTYFTVTIYATEL